MPQCLLPCEILRADKVYDSKVIRQLVAKVGTIPNTRSSQGALGIVEPIGVPHLPLQELARR